MGSVFSQILAAALVIFLVHQSVKYIKWRIAVVKFVRFEADALPKSTPEEEAKSMKLAWKLIYKLARQIPKTQRDEMLVTKLPTDKPGAQMLFAMLRTLDAMDKGEIKADGVENYLRVCTILYAVGPKGVPSAD
jgi:hypothetical protein